MSSSQTNIIIIICARQYNSCTSLWTVSSQKQICSQFLNNEKDLQAVRLPTKLLRIKVKWFSSHEQVISELWGITCQHRCKKRFYVFSARQHICYSTLYAIARPSVRLSVPLSVTRVDQSKTVEVRITQPSPQSSPMTLVSWRGTAPWNSNGKIGSGGAE